MDSERRLCEALEREINQLSAGFLRRPELRKRLLDDVCTLAVCMEGPRAIANTAISSDQGKKDNILEDQVVTDPEDQTQIQSEMITGGADKSTSVMVNDDGPEYETWEDEKGIELIVSGKSMFWSPMFRCEACNWSIIFVLTIADHVKSVPDRLFRDPFQTYRNFVVGKWSAQLLSC